MKKKSVVSIIVLVLLISIISVNIASAITLAQSFSGGTYCTAGSSVFGEGTYYTKTVWAKTSGYTDKNRMHYVSEELPGWFSATRKYGYGDINHPKTSGSILVPLGKHPRKYFPTGYAYYGWA